MTELVPEPRRRFPVTASDGAVFEIRAYGREERPRLILSHGNGFASDGYWPFWKHFLASYELVLFDFRNHGQNPVHGPRGHDWPTFVTDFDCVLTGIEADLGRKASAGIFHSLSSVTSLLHAVEFGWLWAGLVAVEPPILPATHHPLFAEAFAGEKRVQSWALQRPDRFSHPSELAMQWKSKGAFRQWVPGAHELMARSVLRPEPTTGDWVLTCPREFEAKIYRENLHSHLWSHLAAMPGPILVVGGDPDRASNPVTARVARALAAECGLRYAQIPDTTHLLMIEQPETCAGAVAEFLRQIDFAS